MQRADKHYSAAEDQSSQLSGAEESGTTAIRKNEIKKIKDRGAKSQANSEEQGVAAEMHKSCTLKYGEFGSFLKRKSHCNYKY